MGRRGERGRSARKSGLEVIRVSRRVPGFKFSVLIRILGQATAAYKTVSTAWILRRLSVRHSRRSAKNLADLI